MPLTSLKPLAPVKPEQSPGKGWCPHGARAPASSCRSWDSLIRPPICENWVVVLGEEGTFFEKSPPPPKKKEKKNNNTYTTTTSRQQTKCPFWGAPHFQTNFRISQDSKTTTGFLDLQRLCTSPRPRHAGALQAAARFRVSLDVGPRVHLGRGPASCGISPLKREKISSSEVDSL